MDRISDLPCDVIDGILEHLNIWDLVKTSILSRKWRYMWISVPRLEFDEDFLDRHGHFDDHLEVSRIVNQVLSLHSGPIYRFTLVVSRRSDVTITSEDLKRWILFLSKRSLKYLALVHHHTLHPIDVPFDVFTCQELTYLKLGGFGMLSLPNLVNLKSLRVLHLEFVAFWGSGFQNLISGCPLLEELNISLSYGFECKDDTDYQSLYLSAPTIKVLRIEVDEGIDSICLMKSNNAIDLTLLADRNSVSGFIKRLPKIRRLCLHSHRKQMLFADMVPPTVLLNSFSSLEQLKLTSVDLNDRGELLYIVSMMKSASNNLVHLYIESCVDVDNTTQVDHLEELECISCCLSQLQRVEILVKDSCQYAMSLIRSILANSLVLKNLNFYVSGLTSDLSDASTVLSISQDLLLMERVSQQARVLFLHG